MQAIRWFMAIPRLVALVFMLSVGAPPALAGVGGSVVVSFPAVVTLGQTFQVRLTYTNNSDGENLDERVVVSEIRLNPSCTNVLCTVTDPGVFSAAVGQGGFFCAGTIFTPVTAADGTITFQPDAAVELGPASGSEGTNSRKCQIIFNMTVLKLPNDSSPLITGLQTRQTGTAQFTGEDSGLGALGFGTSITAVNQPTISIAKTPDNGTTTAGATATFTIVVTNQGPGAAMGVAIDDTLPSADGLTWQTATPNCQVTANVLHCNVGTLAANASFTAAVSAVVGPQACSVINNTAVASASNAASVQDTGQFTCQMPVLSISKTPDDETIKAGATAKFTIVVTNLGPGPALNVVLDDPLPDGGGVFWSVSSGAGCTVTGAVGLQVLNCPIGMLAQGGHFTASVSAATSLAACDGMDNRAFASGSNAAEVHDDGTVSCDPTGGRMTGGGSIFTGPGGSIRVTHGFQVRCDAKDKRQRLEINWPGVADQNNFHLTDIKKATCIDDPDIAPDPPNAGFDVYIGEGEGTCNGKPATINFIFTDAGEPGVLDTAEYHIAGGCTLDTVESFITNGNHQAHKN